MGNVNNNPRSNVGIDTTAGDFSYPYDIPATSLGLTKLGANTLILMRSDTYTGPTVVEAGTLEINAAAALPTGTSLTVGAGGTFVFDPMQGTASPVVASGTVAVPEPGALALFATASIGLLVYAWRKQKDPNTKRTHDTKQVVKIHLTGT